MYFFPGVLALKMRFICILVSAEFTNTPAPYSSIPGHAVAMCFSILKQEITA